MARGGRGLWVKTQATFWPGTSFGLRLSARPVASRLPLPSP